MNHCRLLLAALVAGLSVVGCTTVKTEYKLPNQALHSPQAPGTSRLVFYNDTNVGLFPASNRIGIKLDGKGVAAPFAGQYVQIDMPRGEHMLELNHYDVFYFVNKYPLTIQDPVLYVRVFCTPLATQFGLSTDVPKSLHRGFRPVALER